MKTELEDVKRRIGNAFDRVHRAFALCDTDRTRVERLQRICEVEKETAVSIVERAWPA